MWLALVPALAGFWVWAAGARRRALLQFAEEVPLRHLADCVNRRARGVKAACITAGIAALALSLMGPQWGFHWQEIKRRGVDLVIALDVSKSMLAEDVKPNRLGRAKLAMADLLPLLKGDRIALVAFAGTAFAQCPLTVDYGAFSLILQETGPDAIPRGGTAIEPAIREGLALLGTSGSVAGSRALVLITDGESQEGDPQAAAREAAKQRVPIFCIGIGTPEGELIRVTDDQGAQRFLKDREGRVVKSRLDEALLQRIAQETGGAYVRATGASFGLDTIYRQRIARMEPQEHGSTMTQQPELRFQWLLLVAWLLLAAEPLISDRLRSSLANPASRFTDPLWLERTPPRRPHPSNPVKVAGWLLAMGLATWMAAGGSEAGEPRLSEERVQRALAHRPENPALHYDLGTLRYRRGDYARAAESLNHAMAAAPEALRGRAAYNLGNAEYRQARQAEPGAPQDALAAYQRALDAYRLAMQQDPSDEDARFNDALTRRRLEALRKRQAQDASSKPSSSDHHEPSAQRQQVEQGQTQQERTQATPGSSETRGEPPQTAQSETSEPQAGHAQEPAARPQEPSGAESRQEAASADATPAPSRSSGSGEREGEGNEGGAARATAQGGETPKDMTTQQALWILDSLRQEEQLARPSPQQGQAREDTVDRDW